MKKRLNATNFLLTYKKTSVYFQEEPKTYLLRLFKDIVKKHKKGL